MKKIISSLLAVLLVFTLGGCSSNETEETTSTTYQGTAKGYKSDITVEVAFDGTVIESVTVTDHHESEGISDTAITSIPEAIVTEQSLAIDTVCGASGTANGIVAATIAALESAGADIDSLMIETDKEEVAADVEETYDVVVIGAGGAGLAAATEAINAGSSVVVIEQMSIVGGNTLICGSGYNAVDPERQGAMGIEDSEELFFEHAMEGGNYENNPDLVRVMVEGAYDGAVFLESYGMEWQDEVSTAPGGMYQRRLMPANGALGVPMINALSKGSEDADIMLNTKAEELIVKDGEVVGVVATGETGNKVTLNANKGVILATGGFSANVEMRQKYNTTWANLDEKVLTTNHSGANGSGIVMAEEAGAALVGMEYIQLFPYGDPVTGAMTGSIMKQPENAIYLNKEGERFVDEYETRDVVASAILEQTDSQMLVVVDGKTYSDDSAPTDFGTTIGEEVAAERSVRGDTIEELAIAMNMDPEVVQKTIDDYNAGVEANNDEFGKTTMNKIDTAPYYGSPRTPTVHHTMGGVEINVNTEVIDVDGNVIPGLYAAGEVTGGVHGTNRVGANALPDIIVFGHIAGTNASKR